VSVDIPREFISVRMGKKEKKKTRPARKAHTQFATKIYRDQRTELRTVNISTFSLSLSLFLSWAAHLFAGDSSIAITVDRSRDFASLPVSLARLELAVLSPGSFSCDFYRVNEVPAPFYNRHGRSSDDDSNNCRAYSRSIDCFPLDVASAIFHGIRLTVSRSGPRTWLSPDENGNPWVTMIIIVRSYLHPNGVVERLLRARRVIFADFC